MQGSRSGPIVGLELFRRRSGGALYRDSGQIAQKRTHVNSYFLLVFVS